MNARRAAAVVIGAAALTVTVEAPASAEPLSGSPCSMATSDEGRPGHQWGWVEAGPAYGPVGVRCSVQLDSAYPGEADVASATGYGVPAELPRTPVQFDAPWEARVYLCTEYVQAGGGIEHHDANPATPGPQCQQAKRTEDSENQRYDVPRDITCYWVERAVLRTVLPAYPAYPAYPSSPVYLPPTTLLCLPAVDEYAEQAQPVLDLLPPIGSTDAVVVVPR